ncbi:MAG: hypothetical protein JWM78_2622 [Verrucomicrobiaceae bacterium]|nr:hypothetical protein [Verrucomicrobiaceae bacterium]
MYKAVLQFWFEEIDPKQWWEKDESFDAAIAARFGELHARAARCELFEWRKTAQGRLAEVIVLDQFSRNIFRNLSLAFANDALALGLAQEAIANGADKELTVEYRNFLYMPFMHSESLKIHHIALQLFSRNGIQGSLDAEVAHKQIIERFGRFPHRNPILGRLSTAVEVEFLKQPGAVF